MPVAEVLSIKGLHVDFERRRHAFTALSGIDLTLAAGERLAIVGASGSGKSTLALAILGLLPDTATIRSGSMRILGRDAATLSQRDYASLRGRSLSLVYQDPAAAFDPIRSIGSQVVAVLGRHAPELSASQLQRKAAELLEQVGIADAAEKLRLFPYEFSGGMRQRVLVALALVNRPAILVADEPTTALDVTIQAEILAMIAARVNESRTALLLITHNLALARGFCDRVVVLHEGRIVESGSVEEIFAAPRADYTKRLLAAIPRIGARDVE